MAFSLVPKSCNTNMQRRCLTPSPKACIPLSLLLLPFWLPIHVPMLASEICAVDSSPKILTRISLQVLWLLPLFCLALLFPPFFPSPSLFLSVPPSPPSIPCWISVSSCGCDMTYSPEIKCIRNEPTSVSYSFCVFLIFWPHCTAGGIIVSWPGIAPCSGSIVLTIGSPGKSPLTVLITARWN